MTVIVPCETVEARKAVIAAEMEGLVYLRIAGPPSPVFLDEDYKF